MCRLKYYTVSHKLGWRLALVTALLFLVLGGISFGYGIKLMEYAEKKDITPIFIAVPMVICSLAGACVVLSRKRCAVICYTIMTVIVSMLSIHMNYRFMVKEYPKLPLYRRNCKLAPEDPYFCHQYVGTIMLCCVAVSMVPVAVGALLSSFVARKTLNKKNCYIVWFSFSKVKPLESIRNNNRPIKLINFKQSANMGEIPETRPAHEYIPDIPDFMELAIPPASPAGYKASVLLQREQNDFDKPSIKNAYSKSVDGLDQPTMIHNAYENSLVTAGSLDVLVRREEKVSEKQGKHTYLKDVLSRSGIDLKFSEQDLKQCYEIDDSKYYDEAAEEWIIKLVDNLNNSRSRLYGVSDEEDLESDNEASDDFSTTKPFLSKQTDEKRIIDRTSEGLENKDTSACQPLLATNDKAIKDTNKHNTNINSEHLVIQSSSSNEITCTTSPPSDKLITNLHSSDIEQYDNVTFPKRKRIHATSSPGDVELNKNNNDEFEYIKDVEDITTSHSKHAGSEVVENVSTELTTPPGLITPMRTGSSSNSPRGKLSFQFDTSQASISEQHDRKNWIEFEGNVDRERLLAGKMTSSEYNDLTSYVM